MSTREVLIQNRSLLKQNKLASIAIIALINKTHPLVDHCFGFQVAPRHTATLLRRYAALAVFQDVGHVCKRRTFS